MLSDPTLERVKKAALPLAEMLSRMNFGDAEEAVATLWDMVNDRRDTLITQARDVIEKMRNMPDYPTQAYLDSIQKLQGSIAMLQGTSAQTSTKVY